jgi:hypothetical protein
MASLLALLVSALLLSLASVALAEPASSVPGPLVVEHTFSRRGPWTPRGQLTFSTASGALQGTLPAYTLTDEDVGAVRASAAAGDFYRVRVRTADGSLVVGSSKMVRPTPTLWLGAATRAPA